MSCTSKGVESVHVFKHYFDEGSNFSFRNISRFSAFIGVLDRMIRVRNCRGSISLKYIQFNLKTK